MSEAYTIIIGLEVHVQLQTQSKLFCGCSTKFGMPPNTQTCPVCIGMPGVLPVMNRTAFQYALKTASALNCEIAKFTKWDRKNYYYPDLPKGYQISQYDLPFSQNGYVMIIDPETKEEKRIGIIRAHLEEDAGKSMHDEQHGKADSLVDLNRTGIPLVEIVSEPDLRSPAQARAYLTELKLMLTYLGVSDCNMQEGSLRVDANINLHIPTDKGKVATPIVEVKNMNSFRAVEKALEYEAKRQYEEWQETGLTIGQAAKRTAGWDDVKLRTFEQRTKEESSDYRYFPEPDLVPVTVTEEQIKAINEEVGELPFFLRQRLEREYHISSYDADVIVSAGRSMVQYYLDLTQQGIAGKEASNWVQQQVMRVLNERDWTVEQFPVKPAVLAELINKKLDKNRATDVLLVMLDENLTADQAADKLGIQEVDESETEAICREVVEANPKVAEDVRGGNEKAVGRLIGQVKKKNPNVDPGKVRELCLQIIKSQ